MSRLVKKKLLSPLLVVLFSCSSFFDQEQPVKRGYLSEAIKKSSDDYKDARKVADSKVIHSNRVELKRDDEFDNNRYSLQPEIDNSRQFRSFRKPSPVPDYKDGSLFLDSLLPTGQEIPHREISDSLDRIDLGLIRAQYNRPFLLDSDLYTKKKPANVPMVATQAPLKQYLSMDTTASSGIRIPVSKPVHKKLDIRRFADCYTGLQGFRGVLCLDGNSCDFTGASFLLIFNHQVKQHTGFKISVAELIVKNNQVLYSSISDFTQISLSVEHRWYTSPVKTAMGLFFPCELSLQSLFWDYRNPIITDVYNSMDQKIKTEEISSDGLPGVTLNCGAGLSFIKINHLLCSVIFTGGFTAYFSETMENFTNDYLDGDLHAKVCLEVLFGINLK